MALTASAFAYTWSKWNADCGKDKIIIQAVEQLHDEQPLEVANVDLCKSFFPLKVSSMRSVQFYGLWRLCQTQEHSSPGIWGMGIAKGDLRAPLAPRPPSYFVAGILLKCYERFIFSCNLGGLVLVQHWCA